jgi:hypothetical protein
MIGLLLSGAIWIGFRAYLGWEPPPRHTETGFFAWAARHACAHARERASPAVHPKRNSRQQVVGGLDVRPGPCANDYIYINVFMFRGIHGGATYLLVRPHRSDNCAHRGPSAMGLELFCQVRLLCDYGKSPVHCSDDVLVQRRSPFKRKHRQCNQCCHTHHAVVSVMHARDENVHLLPIAEHDVETGELTGIVRVVACTYYPPASAVPMAAPR